MILTEEYRSGHNELHSKCSHPQGCMGSNPISSAMILIRSLFVKQAKMSNKGLVYTKFNEVLIIYHTKRQTIYSKR